MAKSYCKTNLIESGAVTSK